jgi:hypothetical protein
MLFIICIKNFIQIKNMKARINENETKELNPTEIGERFISVMNKLQELGVFYGENYGGKYEEKYPHSCYMFNLRLDRHRSGFESLIEDGCGDNTEEVEIAREDTSVEELLVLLEKTFDKLKNS